MFVKQMTYLDNHVGSFSLVNDNEWEQFFNTLKT
jgi:hypothetical protein